MNATVWQRKNKGFLGEHIEVKAMLEERGDIHHLFPKKYLIRNGITSKGQYNQIANYVYLQSEINIKISADTPKDYMAVVLHQCETGESVYGGITDSDQLKRNLEENCIPEDFAQMGIEDYPLFLEQRRVLMAQKIRKFYEALK